MKSRKLLMIMAILVTAVIFASAQEGPRALPEVISHKNPVYPALARQARIRGPVRLRITTDGRSVTDVVALDGHPLLVRAATDNVQTWRFADHIPGTFEVTFDFRLLADKITFLQEPGVVDIAVLPPMYNENSDARLDYTLPVFWDLELKTATDDIKAPLTTWTYGPWLRGYTLGPRGQERELANARVDGNMLGFDLPLDDSHGQRLQFSLIGKKVGERIEGIFLDAWGASGTWSAIPSKPPVPTCAAASTAAEENVIPVPEITQSKQPEYPMLPLEAHIEGQVRMSVSTDTYCVGKVTTQSSDLLLAQSAEANIQSWWFDLHKPGTFNVTFNYRLLRPNVSFLAKPGVVEIWETVPSIGWGPQSGLWNLGGYDSEIWKAQLTGPRGHAYIKFRFPYGCCEEGDVTQAGRGGKEETKQGYNFDDDFGFSTTVRMTNNQPTRVSLIGRRRNGDRIQGVFLDESGISGTWSAQIVSHGPPNVSL
jgi:outer membrane biosynthesis protein TonB